MKTLLPYILASIASVALNTSNAATVIFDDFSTGRFSIGSSGLAQTTNPITSPFADTRTTLGSGFSDWAAQVNITSTTLSYSLSIPGGILAPDQKIQLNYASSLGNFNLLGYDSFVFHVSALSGAGQIMAYFDDTGHQSGASPVNLTSTGDLYIPFTNANPHNPAAIDSIHFWILPQDANFSVTFTGISVIPEPSALILSALGACILLFRRRTECRQQNKTSLLTPDPPPVPPAMTATTSTPSSTLAPGQA